MSEELYNSRRLSKLTGVAESTISMWVKNKTIVPVTIQNDKPMFNDATRVTIMRRFVKDYAKQSFLGVIVETSEERVESEKAKFYTAVNTAMPSCRSVVSIDEAILGMINGDPIAVSEDFERVFSSQCVAQFAKSWEEYVFSTMFKILTKVPSALDMPSRFILDLIVGDTVNPELLSRYRSFSFDDTSVTVDGLKQGSLASFDALARKYGIYVPLHNANLSMADVFHGKAVVALEGQFAIHDELAPAAKKLYDEMTKTLNAKSVRSGLQQLFSNGFCTCVDGVGALSVDSETFVMKSIVSGDYSVVYVSSLTSLSPVLSQTLQTLHSNHSIDLIIADAVV